MNLSTIKIIGHTNLCFCEIPTSCHLQSVSPFLTEKGPTPFIHVGRTCVGNLVSISSLLILCGCPLTLGRAFLVNRTSEFQRSLICHFSLVRLLPCVSRGHRGVAQPQVPTRDTALGHLPGHLCGKQHC